MVDFAGALSAAATGVKILKELNQVNKALDEATLKLKIAELSSSLASMQMALAEAQSESAAKEAEITKLKAYFKRKDENTIRHHGYVFNRGDDGKPEGLPYCPACLEKGTMMQIVRSAMGGRNQQCPECKMHYNAPEYVYR